MRARMLAAAAVLMILGVTAAQVEFKQYASTDGRFKVQFPGPVKTETVEVPSGKDKLTITIDSNCAADRVHGDPCRCRLRWRALLPARGSTRFAMPTKVNGKVLEERIAIGMKVPPATPIQTPSGYMAPHRNRRPPALPGDDPARRMVTSASSEKFPSFEVTKQRPADSGHHRPRCPPRSEEVRTGRPAFRSAVPGRRRNRNKPPRARSASSRS